ncbi:hypothetical protein JCM16814_21420 [Desulfobaculum senezii]
MALSGIGSGGLGAGLGGATLTPPERPQGASAGGATSGEALAREAEKVRKEQEAKEQAAKLEQSKMDFIAKYVKSFGAPEELDRDKQSFKDRLRGNGEDPDKSEHMNALAFETLSEAVQDPNDEGKITVYATKVDGEGNGKISRAMEFDSGDGEDRSQLTPERRRAAKMYEQNGKNEQAVAGGEKDDESPETDKMV